MFYNIYDRYEGEDIYVGSAFDHNQAEKMMIEYFSQVDDEANLYAIREDGKVFVLGDHWILEEVKQ